MNRDLRAAWIADLRSGEFAQTTGTLYRREPLTDLDGEICAGVGMCCLGVLANRISLMHPGKFEWIEDHRNKTSTGFLAIEEERDDHYGEGTGRFVDFTIEAEFDGFANVPGIRLGDMALALMGLNDDEGKDFHEIADWIEENVPEDDDEIPTQTEGHA